MRRTALSAVVFALLVMAAPSSQETATVTVDFGTARLVNSASGLLFGTTTSTTAQTLAPVRPRLWRFADMWTPSTGYLGWVPLAQAFQAIVPDGELNFLLAQSWGFPVSNWNGANHQPWLNWSSYETHLTNLVRTLDAADLTGIFEVWNEPDFPEFWNGTRAQFHELYDRAYRVIRQELGPDVAVGGPSFGVYDHAAIENFLDYCLVKGCEVNALIFHANDDTPAGIAAYPANVQDARVSFVENPKYAPLKIRRIVNNELGGPIYTRQPAGTLAHYAAFEAGGAAAAARSCWNVQSGASDCFNGTLDGLLAPVTLQPAAVWWAHKYYVDGVAARVRSTVSSANLVALASRATLTEPAQVLVGHVDFQKSLLNQSGSLSPRLVLANVLSIPGFAGAPYVAARVESIPATGEAALTAPPLVEVQTAPIAGGSAELVLPPIGVGGVLRITLEPRRPDLPGPPVVTTPANRNVPLGGTTTFEVTAGGNPSPTLQWQMSTNGGVSWANVLANATFSGVTTGMLTIVKVPSALANARFRCIATNASGAATSGAATLTVGPPASLNLSRDLVAYGIAGLDATPNSPSLDARPLFAAGIAYAVQHDIPTVTVDPGNYYFLTADQPDRFLSLWQLSNLTIDLAGSTLFLKTGFLHGIILTECAAVTLKNFTVDYVTPPYTHAALTAVEPNARTLSYSALPGFADPVTLKDAPAPYGAHEFWAVIFRNGAIVPGTSRLRIQTPEMQGVLHVVQDGAPWTQAAALSTLKAGDTIVVAPRGGGSPIYSFRGDSVLVSNVTVQGSGAAALMFEQTTNSSADGVRVRPRPGFGLVGSNGTGIRFASARQSNHIRNAVVSGTLDDAIAMDSLSLATVLHQSGPRQVRVRRSGWWRFPNGTSVNFVDAAATLEWPGGVIAAQNPADGDLFGAEIDLTFDRDQRTLAAGDHMVFATATQRGQGSTVADNVVSGIPFGRGIWLGGNRGVTIERNHISGTSSGGIVLSQTTGGPDAPPAQDVVVQDNTIAGVLGPMASGGGSVSAFAAIVVHSIDRNGAFAHAGSNRGIVLRRNTITDSGRGGIWLGQTDGAVIEDNVITGWNRYSTLPVWGLNQEASVFAAEDFGKAIAVRHSVNVTQSRNTATGPAGPPIAVDKQQLAFSAASDGSGFVGMTAAQPVRLVVNGSAAIPWTVSSNQSWLRVTPESGSGTATLMVSILAGAALPIGSYEGTLSVSTPGGGPPVATITVTLMVQSIVTVTAPFGSFDTPIDGTTQVTGSIAVTGWALDDLGVVAVRILRDPVGAEAPGQLVFIGNAVFVEGARSDIAHAYAAMPMKTRAGWGYLMLTNFLPNQGNGTFKLYAIADDVEGHSTILGTTTIVCANAASNAPFGAIDRPLQGETVSGLLNNFGWTLVKNGARADIPGGGTVQVLIDGTPIGSPAGWTHRDDLTTLFPSGFSDMSSTLAVLPIDTRTLSNGVHTIAWIVTATNGQGAGIGSRYFTVSNGAALTAAPVTAASAGDALADASVTVSGRRGFDLDARYETYAPGADGAIEIQSEELDRIEVRTGARSASLLTPEGRGQLPIGAQFDAATGVFTWQPGVGYVGAYEFQFDTRRVRIVLNPKGRIAK